MDMRQFEEGTLALELGFMVESALWILSGMGTLPWGESLEPEESLRDVAERLEWLYLTDASEVVMRHPGYLRLSTGSLKEDIQRAAEREGRMANQMVERVVETLRALAKGNEISDGDRETAMKLMLFVAQGTLTYSRRLHDSGVPRLP